MTLKDASMVKSMTSMVGTPVLIKDNGLPLSGRPLYLKTDLENLDRLKTQLRQARLDRVR